MSHAQRGNRGRGAPSIGREPGRQDDLDWGLEDMDRGIDPGRQRAEASGQDELHAAGPQEVAGRRPRLGPIGSSATSTGISQRSFSVSPAQGRRCGAEDKFVRSDVPHRLTNASIAREDLRDLGFSMGWMQTRADFRGPILLTLKSGQLWLFSTAPSESRTWIRIPQTCGGERPGCLVFVGDGRRIFGSRLQGQVGRSCTAAQRG